MRPAIATVSSFLLFLPLGGCCAISQGLSAVFCGPREPMPRRAYFTPNQALKTFLAAASSDDSETIWETFGPDLRKRLGGEIEWEVAWKKIKETTPGIHLADQAEPRNPKPVVHAATPSRRFALTSFTLTLPSTSIEVRMRKYVFWKVVFQTAGMKQPEEVSDYVPALDQVAKLRWVPPNTEIDLSLPGVPWAGLKPTEILHASAGIEWLVFDFRIVQ